jgi:polar amino acid transport system substrate-binding protein
LLCARFNAFLREFIASGERDQWIHDWSNNPDSMAVARSRIPASTEGETIVNGITLTYPFIFMKDEQLAGLEIDLMERFCRWGGYRADYRIVDFPALIPALNTGKVDALVSHIQVTPERAKQVLFSEPYFEGSICCFGRDPEAAASPRKGLVQAVRDSVYANLIMEQHWKLLLQGLLVTLEISLFSILLSILLGAGFCFLRMRRSPALSRTVKLFAETVQGIPVLVVLMIMCYVIFAKSHISGTLVAIFSFALFYGARFCELFRSGMLGVGRGQWEAGAALGLSKFQTFRLVALPQAFRRIIPVFKGEIVALIKSTSIVGYVAVMDLTCASNVIRARTFDAFFPLILVSVIYILLSRLSAHALNALERKVNSKK